MPEPVTKQVRQGLRQVPFAVDAVHFGRDLRRRYLRAMHPDGAFRRCLGIEVFCNFKDPTWLWYELDSPNLAFDLRVLRAAAAHVTGDTVIDIGAHFGFFVGAMRSVFASSTIVAVEPDPGYFRCLRETATRAGGRVVTINAAMADSDGELTLYGGSGPCPHSYASANERPVGTVAARSLDSIVEEHVPEGSRVGLVKIDVDGAETQVLAGASKTVEQHRPLLFIEFAPREMGQAGVSPEHFFFSLVERYQVHFVSYRELTVDVVDKDDFPQLMASIGDGIGDLLLSPSPIVLAL